jgi:DNA-binding MarR family transcriptional regulator
MSADRADAGGLPLSALLSQALVAFTIEFDNSAELRIVHKTTDHGGARGGVWLVSMAMYLNCMRYASEDPITVAEMRRLARTGTNLDGMRRWGYITLSGAKPHGDTQTVRATGKGLAAKAVWEPLTAEIEQRWRERYGAGPMSALTRALTTVAGQLGSGLPDCLPILGFGLFTDRRKPGNRYGTLDAAYGGAPAGQDAAELPLPWLLARVTLALAVEFELEAETSLAIAANVLRVLDQDGVRVRDLPGLSGVSVEGLSMATGYLQGQRMAVVGTDPDGRRWKMARLTEKGERAARAGQELLARLEDRWRQRYGEAAICALRAALQALVGEPVLAAIEPGPGNWRAAVSRPATLPQYPMVLHRGGYPDGS